MLEQLSVALTLAGGSYRIYFQAKLTEYAKTLLDLWMDFTDQELVTLVWVNKKLGYRIIT